MISIPCHCGNTIETEVDEVIELESKPEIYSDIIEGKFLSFECPKCGNEVKTEARVRLTDKKQGIDIDFIPESDRMMFLSGKITTKAKRVVIGYNELVEKITCFGAKLDDRAIEIIKFNMLEKAESDLIRIFFNNKDNEELIFHIHGLKPEQIGISRLPMAVYAKIIQQLDELLKNDDIKLFTKGPYVSVEQIYLED